MIDSINKFNPAANWVTTGLLTMVIASFAIFVETHASERNVTLGEVSTDVTDGISTHATRLFTGCEHTIGRAIENQRRIMHL